MVAKTQRVEFAGVEGRTLAGSLHRPEGEPRAYALFVHCFTCSKDQGGAYWISRALAERGVAVLRFDFAETTLAATVGDVRAAAAYLAREHRAPALLVGHSRGGAAAVVAAAGLPDIRAVAVVGAPSDPRPLGAELEGTPLLDRLPGLGRALLVLHSPVDEVVDIDHARRLYEAARHPKSFVSLDGSDHLLTREADARYVAEVIAAWAGRYLPAPPPPAQQEGRQVVVEGGPRGYAQRIAAGGHVLWSDEPASVPGGTDAGPTPYGLLLAALGACTSMTLRMYADRKQWPLAGIRVALSHTKIHAEDCADCATKQGKVDVIQRLIALEGPLDQEQRQRLLEIANRCPVHRTLTAEIRVASELVISD